MKFRNLLFSMLAFVAMYMASSKLSAQHVATHDLIRGIIHNPHCVENPNAEIGCLLLKWFSEDTTVDLSSNGPIQGLLSEAAYGNQVLAAVSNILNSDENDCVLPGSAAKVTRVAHCLGASNCNGKSLEQLLVELLPDTDTGVNMLFKKFLLHSTNPRKSNPSVWDLIWSKNLHVPFSVPQARSDLDDLTNRIVANEQGGDCALELRLAALPLAVKLLIRDCRYNEKKYQGQLALDFVLDNRWETQFAAFSGLESAVAEYERLTKHYQSHLMLIKETSLNIPGTAGDGDLSDELLQIRRLRKIKREQVRDRSKLSFGTYDNLPELLRDRKVFSVINWN